MNPFDFILWYVHQIVRLSPVIIPAVMFYIAYDVRQDRKRRKQARQVAVMAYAKQFGVTYEEADRIIIYDRPKY